MATCKTCGGAMLSERPHAHSLSDAAKRIIADDLYAFGITSPAIERDRTHPYERGGGCMSKCRSCGKTFSDPVHGPQPENIRRIKEALRGDTDA